MNWQYDFINKIFESGYSSISSIYNELSLLNCKSKFIPESLYRFYPATAQNLIDIKNRKLWLSSPKDFNDPFDCILGYDKQEYLRKTILNYIISTLLSH